MHFFLIDNIFYTDFINFIPLFQFDSHCDNCFLNFNKLKYYFPTDRFYIILLVLIIFTLGQLQKKSLESCYPELGKYGIFPANRGNYGQAFTSITSWCTTVLKFTKK